MKSKPLCCVCEKSNLTHWIKYSQRDKRELLICPNCGFKRQSCIINNQYYYKHTLDSMNSFWFEKVEKRTLKHWEILEKHIKQGSKIIDLGCGPGTLAYFVKTNNIGVEVTSVDLNERWVSVGKEKGIDVIQLDIEKSLIVDLGSDFDLVYSSHVLEHVKEPKETLLNWLQLLKSGGLMFLEVPDESTMFVESEVSKLEHLSYFNKETLKTLFYNCGLDILYLGKVTSPFRNVEEINILVRKGGN